MKILICFGTRPEAIKLAPVILELKRFLKLNFRICVTAQHREMLDQVLEFFEIIPDYDLNLMQADQSLNDLGSKIAKGIDAILEDYKPNLVLLQGDTTSALFIALAAFNRGIEVGHVEAGLRTYNLTAPFPEEGNRQMISRIAKYHFAPTEIAKANLLREGLSSEFIFLTGNTVVDAINEGRRRLKAGYINEDMRNLRDQIEDKKKIILVTAHRRENFGKGLEEICAALKVISRREDTQIIFPVHFNPNVRAIIGANLSELKNVKLISPVSYPALLYLLEICSMVISDSGGIQEEAPSFKKPLIVTREVSERQEGVAAGFSFLTGTSTEKIILEANKLLDSPPHFNNVQNPYGDGNAARRILEIISESNE